VVSISGFGLKEEEGQNLPKRGSAQPFGSNSGGAFSQALNGSTNILSA
jgi:hypothetical protein